MKKVISLFVIVLLAVPFTARAQGTFTRSAEIEVPETTLNNGGVGNMIAGVDLDGDSKLEIYLVNDNWGDTPGELIPRIYKLEYSGTAWEVVWQAVAPIPTQNTWPTMAISDLDDDGKPEILWGVVNFTGAGNENPARMLVYEMTAVGSDDFGVADGDNFLPNSSFTIVPAESLYINLRPMQIVVADVDNDGTDEIVFADRKGNDDGYYFGVMSVDDIPDDGAGTETWTLEVSGKDFGDLSAQPIENKWDVAVIDSTIYTFCEVEISKLAYANGTWTYTALSPLKGGASVQSAQVVDLDSDGKKEIVVAVYDWGDDANKGIYLLQESGDTLTHHLLANLAEYWPSGERGIQGGSHGDIDQDGYLDFVFGTRGSTPDGAIFRLAYKGGPIIVPSVYELTVIDSLYGVGGIWNNIEIVNMDADPELEVVYTSSIPVGGIFSGTAKIVVLDYTSTSATESRNIAPVMFVLNQNYPNPFNPSTTIAFELTKSMAAKLVVYDLLGHDVVTLMNGNLSPGSHSFDWNGRNALGEAMPTGIYITRLTGPDQSKHIKMVLLK